MALLCGSPFRREESAPPSPPASKKGPGSVKKDGGNGRRDSNDVGNSCEKEEKDCDDHRSASAQPLSLIRQADYSKNRSSDSDGSTVRSGSGGGEWQ
ncbi:hypothetical protein TYRP_006303 [Tyrophagus putrescentiae]|nr:hypothetical protein TYRP_006303 [Tyrophagus putrescentiae]